MKFFLNLILVAVVLIITSCGEKKRLTKGNYYYKYVDNSSTRLGNQPKQDQLVIYHFDQAQDFKLEDKTTYQVVSDPIFATAMPFKTIDLKKDYPAKIKLNGVIYTNESDINEAKVYQRSLRYWERKLTVAPLTIPLKFRSKIDDGSKYPAQLETGINIGFSPAYKFTYNVYNPTKKYLGNTLNQYSISVGPFLNIGGTALKAASNAPGLPVDREAATWSYGGAIVFGVNKISFGYALGADQVMGDGKSYWVYQKKAWQGILFSFAW
jgi:hypothetical protein